ncbi:hypothetical protein D3C85_1267520 [compost metagenome]
MSRAREKVVSIAARRIERDADSAFLGLLNEDIAKNPDRIEPIPAGIFDRMSRLRAKAEANRARTELLEG